jgi:two-component system copper resistance phosphate regulon response regulator CusR
MRILLVEDEHDAAHMLAKGLREHSHAVDVSHDGDDALERVSINDYDLLVLDVMLPRRSGLDVCREVRRSGSTVPILMLTARNAVEARVAGLDAGADDYLTKPFAFDELLARVRALGRRMPAIRPDVITVGDLEIDTRAKAVKRNGEAIELTAKEFALLEFLAHRQGEVVGRAEIAEHVWDDTFDPFSNLIEVYVQRLRRKTEANGGRRLIYTRRGQGYVMTTTGDGDAADD